MRIEKALPRIWACLVMATLLAACNLNEQIESPPPPERTPPNVQLPGWENVKVEKLQLIHVSESGSIWINQVKLFLEHSGIETVETANNSDAALMIALEGEATGWTYTIGYCYSGALVEGKATFTAEDHDPVIWPIRVYYPPPESIPKPSCIREKPKESRILEDAWDEANMEVFLVLAQLWGPEVFTRTIEDMWGEPFGDETAIPLLPGTALEVLEMIGPDAIEAVPTLIRTLKIHHQDLYIRGRVRDALRAITAQDFGDDHDAWQQWWNEQ